METVAIPFGQNGSIRGVVVDQYVNRFTGVPFALPPLGNNRWKRPEKLPPDFFRQLAEPYDATEFKDICLQPPTPVPRDMGQPARVR